MGASAAAVYHWNFSKPRLFFGLGVGGTYRLIKFQVPPNYSLKGSEARFLNYVIADMSFPIAPRFEIFQRLGIPADGKDHLWQLGLRRQ